MDVNFAILVFYAVMIFIWTMIVFYLCLFKPCPIHLIFVFIPYVSFILGIIYYQEFISDTDTSFFLVDVLPYDIIVVFLTLLSLVFFNHKLNPITIQKVLIGITLIISSMIRFAFPNDLRFLQSHFRYSLVNMGICLLIITMFDIAIESTTEVKLNNSNLSMLYLANDTL